MYTNETQFNCGVKLRYREIITPEKVSIQNTQVTIDLSEPVLAVTSSQLTVFYLCEKVIHSSWIKETK